MNAPFLNLTQSIDGWQASFAFQVFQRSGEEWMKMRWGFNAGILLEEALDRHKLFIESQVASEADFRLGTQLIRTLALRGMNLPGSGLQMAVLGRISAPERLEADQAAQSYARTIYSTFPHDFILVPAETAEDYSRLAGNDLLCAPSAIAQLQRGTASAAYMHDYHFLFGLWQASSRSNEQIWRALSNVPHAAMFNVHMQPTFFYEGERKALQEVKKQILDAAPGSELTSPYVQWIESMVKRRLAVWKKFFNLQVHVIAEHELDDGLLRSIGSPLTRDTNDLQLPGFQAKWPESESTAQAWRQNILSMEFVPASRVEDLADSDEAYAVFRYPYRPEAGLPGANFISLPKPPSPPDQGEQGS